METLNANISPTGRSNLPGVPQLTDSWGWAEPYSKIEPLQEEVKELEQELQEIRSRPRDRSSVKAALKDLYAKHEERRRTDLANALLFVVRQGRLHDLTALASAPVFRNSGNLAVNFTLPELEQGAAAMPEPANAISDKERGKALRDLTSKRDRAMAKIRELSNAVPVGLEVAGRFCEHWRSIQSRIEEPVSITGKPLQEGPEREAWKTLGVQAFMGKRRPKGKIGRFTAPMVGLR